MGGGGGLVRVYMEGRGVGREGTLREEGGVGGRVRSVPGNVTDDGCQPNPARREECWISAGNRWRNGQKIGHSRALC